MTGIADPLTPVEARRLRWRRRAGLSAAACGFAAIIASMFALADLHAFAWLAVAVPVVVAIHLLNAWGQRCPRCRRSVFGPLPADTEAYHGGEVMLLFPSLPERCRSCEVPLRPEPKGVPDVSPSESSRGASP